MATVITNASRFVQSEKRRAKNAEKMIADVVLSRSTVLAPKLSGDLKADGRVEGAEGGGLRVKFGGASVPYARRRHFENDKNPQTLDYLKKGGDSVGKESIGRYFK